MSHQTPNSTHEGREGAGGEMAAESEAVVAEPDVATEPCVSKVEIDTPGVTIRMESGDLGVTALAELALKTYRDAGGWPHPTPSAIGFTTERRDTYDVHDSEQFGDGRQIDGN